MTSESQQNNRNNNRRAKQSLNGKAEIIKIEPDSSKGANNGRGNTMSSPTRVQRPRLSSATFLTDLNVKSDFSDSELSEISDSSSTSLESQTMLNSHVTSQLKTQPQTQSRPNSPSKTSPSSSTRKPRLIETSTPRPSISAEQSNAEADLQDEEIPIETLRQERENEIQEEIAPIEAAGEEEEGGEEEEEEEEEEETKSTRGEEKRRVRSKGKEVDRAIAESKLSPKRIMK